MTNSNALANHMVLSVAPFPDVLRFDDGVADFQMMPANQPRLGVADLVFRDEGGCGGWLKQARGWADMTRRRGYD